MLYRLYKSFQPHNLIGQLDMEMCSNRHNSDSEVNTSRSTSWAVKCFQNYLKNKLLCKFHGSIVSNQGHYYSISSSVGLRDDVRRFITTPPLSEAWCIMQDNRVNYVK